MKRIIISFLIFGFILAGTGCQSYDQGTVSSDPVAYLSFDGDMEGVEIQLDGIHMPEIEAGMDNRLKTTPGTHSLRILRNGVLLVDRNLFLGNGQIREIIIP